MSVRRAQDERIEGTPDGNSAITAIMDIPDAPTIGTATDLTTGGSVTVAFTAAATGGTPTSYTATSSPGSITGTGASSPITVTGLTDGTSYTFTVTATNSTGTSPASAASNSVTPTGTAYYSIATVTGTGSSGTITFSSIPSTYKHLQIRISGATTSTGVEGYTAFYVKMNSDGTAGNYKAHALYGDGTTTGSYALNGYTTGMRLNDIVNNYSSSTNKYMVCPKVIDILDYANSNKYKTVRELSGWDTNASAATYPQYVELVSGLWMSTSAITQLDIILGDNSFTTGTKVALYGIKGA